MANLCTTTWRKRNMKRLELAKDEACKRGIQNPAIIDIGPGASVGFMLNSLPEGRRDSWTFYQKAERGVLKPIEALLRKTGLFSLKTSEPREIAEVFLDMKPKGLYVIDIEGDVLKASKRALKGYPSIPAEYCSLNLIKEQIPYKGDIVFAYHVATRTENPELALKNIANSVNEGGLLSIAPSYDMEGFKMLAHGLYLKEKTK